MYKKENCLRNYLIMKILSFFFFNRISVVRNFVKKFGLFVVVHKSSFPT